MSTGLNSYGDISNRTAAYAVRKFLDRAQPYMVLEMFGQSKPMPSNSTKTMIFRRYDALDTTPNALTEGVTPSGKKLSATDVTVNLVQYGDLVEITDVVQDTHEDPVLDQAVDVLSEQAAQMIETVRYNILKAGTSVFYGTGSARTDVNNAMSLTLQRKVTRFLKGQNAKRISKVMRPGPDYASSPVAPSFVALCHPDLEADIRNMAGFTPVEQYAGITPWASEIGKVEDVRYVTSTIFAPWEGGGATTTTMLYTTVSAANKADVYPVLIVGVDAYGLVALKGKYAVQPTVLNPNTPRGGDPLGQRGSVGWKSMQAAVILNDLWMARVEVGVTAL